MRAGERMRSGFGVADLGVVIVGVALACAIPGTPDLAYHWNAIRGVGVDPRNRHLVFWNVLPYLACDVIARACLAMIPVLIWRSARTGRTLRAAELLMVALAAPLLFEPMCRGGWLDYVAVPYPGGEAFFGQVRIDPPLRTDGTPSPPFDGRAVSSNRMGLGTPAPRTGHYSEHGIGMTVPTRRHLTILLSIWSLGAASIAARIGFRRRLPPWGLSALMVVGLLGSTSWAVDPLTNLVDHRVSQAGLSYSFWSELAWRFVDAFEAIVPALLAIAAVRDLAQPWRETTACQWIGLVLGALILSASLWIQYSETSGGGEFTTHGPALYLTFANEGSQIPPVIVPALFFVVPLSSGLVALLISATLRPSWNRWTAGRIADRSKNPITPEA